MIEKHWDDIAAYCRRTHQIPFGFDEGFNNKIQIIPRKAYSLRDEEYLRLRILSSVLPPLKINH